MKVNHAIGHERTAQNGSFLREVPLRTAQRMVVIYDATTGIKLRAVLQVNGELTVDTFVDNERTELLRVLGSR